MLKTFYCDCIITELTGKLSQGLLLLLSLEQMNLLLVLIGLLLEVQLLVLCDSLCGQQSIEITALICS